MSPRLRGATLATCSALLVGCTTLGGGPRAARSTAECARASVREVVTHGMDDKRAHCVGAARIAVRCSVAEARIAMYAKEIADAAGAGDPELRDLDAGRRGIECARDRAVDVAACCAARGY